MPQTVLSSAAPIRVVVADDHPSFREFIRTMLNRATSARFEVVGEAGDGAEALTLVRALRPDAVVSDLYMPGMDGIELRAAVQTEFPDITVVLVSADPPSGQSARSTVLSKAALTSDALVAALAPEDHR